ncbi:MAG: divergent polysaccharide deacetylase family protein [Mariprofundaceae bacterium]|nr:divergent polysaccharide deacetylase family protein [Mariprofundaceae bacterium]
MIWSSYSQQYHVANLDGVASQGKVVPQVDSKEPFEAVNNRPSVKPVYEDITSPLLHKGASKPAASAFVKTDQTVYQYDRLRQHGTALVIDDVGYDLPALRRILALGLPVAIAIIPDAPYAREAAEIAHRAGHMVMLHMPMEPANPHYRARMDGSFLRSDMSEETVTRMLRKGLEKVPYVQGINNHMGSFLTSMPEPMAWVMAFCKKNKLFFIDSKTIATSIVSDIAKSYGLRWAERRVFLDHSIKEADMNKAWARAEHYAKQQGGCIVIAHPHPETLNFLEKNASYLQRSMHRVVDLLHVPRPTIAGD